MFSCHSLWEKIFATRINNENLRNKTNIDFDSTEVGEYNIIVYALLTTYKLCLLSLHINNVPLVYVDSNKYLGFTFSRNHKDDDDKTNENIVCPI